MRELRRVARFYSRFARSRPMRSSQRIAASNGRGCTSIILDSAVRSWRLRLEIRRTGEADGTTSTYSMSHATPFATSKGIGLFSGTSRRFGVFTINTGDRRIRDDGVGGVALTWRKRDGMMHRRIYYAQQDSSVETMRLFLHELGHHIASYVDGTYSAGDFSVGFRHNTHVRQRMAEYWAGAILYRLNEAEPGRFALEPLFRRWGSWDYSSNFLSKADRVATLREGWRHSEYGDSPFWYYGEYDQDWVYRCPHEHPAVLASTDSNAPIIEI